MMAVLTDHKCKNDDGSAEKPADEQADKNAENANVSKTAYILATQRMNVQTK